MGIKNRIKTLIFSKGINTEKDNQNSTAEAAKTWEGSQAYEWDATVKFMSQPDFRKFALSAYNNEEQKISSGHIPELTLKEFFGGSEAEWLGFVKHITGKKCLEIGSCTSSVLSGWDVASDRIVIEPLANKVSSWQRKNFGFSLYEGITTHSIGAEQYVETLEKSIDGAIYCRNCIDHSPEWMFILSNISSYALPGCKLLLWNDIFHVEGADSGHYDLTTNTSDMKRLIESLGYNITREYIDIDRKDLNWGCYASKRG